MPDISAINSALIKASADTRRAINNVRADLYLPPENVEKIVSGKQSETRTLARNLVQQAEEEAATRRARLKAQMDSSYLPAGDATAATAENEATWRRLKGLLDSGVSAPAIIDDARKRGDKRTIHVLGQEMRAYNWATSGDVQDADYLDRALSEARYQTGPQEYRAAADGISAVDQAMNAIQTNASSVEAELDPANTRYGFGADLLLNVDGTTVQNPAGEN